VRSLRQTFEPLWELFKTNMLEWFRSGLAVYIVIPILVIGGLGYIGQSQGVKLQVGVLEGPENDAFAKALEEQGTLGVRRVARAKAEKHLQRGDVALVVLSGDPLSLLTDPTSPELSMARLVLVDEVEKLRGQKPELVIAEQTSSERGLRYADFLVPGFLGFMLISAALGVSSNLVEDRQRKLLKRYAASPMKRWHYLVGHGLARVAVALLTLPIVFLAGRLIYQVTLRGSVVTFLGFLVFGMMMLTGIGFIMGSRFERTEQTHTFSTLINMPQLIVTGAFFSLDNRFPAAVVKVLRCLPTTAYVDGLRAVMNDGASMAQIAPQIGVLLAWGVPSLLIALKIFRWQ
jgi:ABC-2 type transport system permease protein